MPFAAFNLLREIKHVVMALIMAVLLLGVCACGSTATYGLGKSGLTWQEQYDLGVRYLSEGNYEKAIIAFTAAIEIDPNQALAYVGRGDAYVRTAQPGDVIEDENMTGLPLSAYQDALADYLYAIRLDKHLAEVYQHAAEIYILLGEQAAAEELLQQGIEVTQSTSLRDFLDKLQTKELLTVLTHVTYRTDKSDVVEQYFTYNEQGYNVRGEAVFISPDGTEIARDITTCTYDGEPGYCHYETNHWSLFGTGREDKSGERKIRAGIPVAFIAGYGTSESPGVQASEAVSKKKLDEIKENGGILVPSNEMDPNHALSWDHAVYTFDDAGNPITVTSYRADGSITGTATYEWTTMEIIN